MPYDEHQHLDLAGDAIAEVIRQCAEIAALKDLLGVYRSQHKRSGCPGLSDRPDCYICKAEDVFDNFMRNPF